MKKKIMIAGTFDILHPGHIYLINEAAKLGEVYVVVATDKNRKLYSGKSPIVSEDQRLEIIKNVKNVKKAVLGRKDNNTLKTVEEIDPDIVLLGPDQNFDEKKLQTALRERGLKSLEVRRLNTFYEKFQLNSSSKIKNKIFKTYLQDENEL
ncbi:MAG: adenylyltransferase/cytidyltransferase family protein [Candidatus Lokiarchaeota archaeon]|nr:adenylyltransferase/cytidyltransferase family protein [Candidatus Lokiarchaeota archaeon]MBD3198784.1 adenylyltransferase/cytidyltransferase family protein [Candidatus Lokiarchaeota archaeon]